MSGYIPAADNRVFKDLMHPCWPQDDLSTEGQGSYCGNPGYGSCFDVAILAGLEISTYHVFNELSPPPLQHPHSLGYIHHPLALDLLTQETSSTEDPTPAGSIPAEEGKGRVICSGIRWQGRASEVSP